MAKDHFIQDIIDQMTPEEKTGALMTLGFAGVVPKPNVYEYITRLHCGGLSLSPEFRHFGSYVDPETGKKIMDIGDTSGVKYPKASPVCKPSDYRAVLDDYQRVARSRRFGIPLHLATDMEGGSSTDPLFNEFPYYPKQMGLRATGSKENAYKVAKAQGRLMRSIGLNWTYSPILDVNQNPRNPEIYTRAYSDDPDVVLDYAIESCRGFRDAGIIATGKHFPGRGRSGVDAHFAEPVLSVSANDLFDVDLLPYRGLIERNLLPTIMTAHTIFSDIDPNNFATLSRHIMTDLLRVKLGFQGVVMTDSMTMGAIVKGYGVAESCILALEAGCDTVLIKPESSMVEESYEAILKAIVDGRLPMEEIDQKLTRILSMKKAYGLFDEANDPKENPDDVAAEVELHALAREMAQDSLTIYKNEIMPLAKDQESTLIIEQKVKQYNLLSWHSGMFYERCRKHNPRVSYLETDLAYDETDRQEISRLVPQFDTIVLTSFFMRGNRKNLPFWEELIARHPEKNFVFVSNTPYETLSIPSEAKNVIISYSMAPEPMLNAADYLFGQAEERGEWPLTGPNKI